MKSAWFHACMSSHMTTCSYKRPAPYIYKEVQCKIIAYIRLVTPERFNISACSCWVNCSQWYIIQVQFLANTNLSYIRHFAVMKLTWTSFCISRCISLLFIITCRMFRYNIIYRQHIAIELKIYYTHFSSIEWTDASRVFHNNNSLQCMHGMQHISFYLHCY